VITCVLFLFAFVRHRHLAAGTEYLPISLSARFLAQNITVGLFTLFLSEACKIAHLALEYFSDVWEDAFASVDINGVFKNFDHPEGIGVSLYSKFYVLLTELNTRSTRQHHHHSIGGHRMQCTGCSVYQHAYCAARENACAATIRCHIRAPCVSEYEWHIPAASSRSTK
jgi:hypothetical protein